jgi:hypothetical protein
MGQTGLPAPIFPSLIDPVAEMNNIKVFQSL